MDTSTAAYPLVSISIVNYNTTDYTRKLLHSLRNITYSHIEIFVVDNASADSSCDDLKVEFPEIHLLKSPVNLGYAGANNLAIRQSKGELVLIMNNDIEVQPGFMEPLVSTFLAYPKAGMASPRIQYAGADKRIQYAGSPGIHAWTGRGKKTGHMQKDRGQYSYFAPTKLVHGACMMVSRALIKEAGLYPEQYFLYYEEHDWAMKARSKGFELYYVGTSCITHYASATAGANSPMKTYYMIRNRLLFLRRNHRGLSRLAALLVFIFLAFPKKLFQYLWKRDYANLKATMAGVKWHLSPVATDKSRAFSTQY
ncbi:glycosyltransferase family 2 protein [Marinoscillum furvescens]|uniref:Glycosyltransferase 2-like domain-containing protein n=1 Tax=Marinoscillum furvescens DSM 4134 TaxID=1122208 RepID=A0A3D9L1B1_MARFU|nr:glycosyltransferase family 2 protein [Marinoscillum furvescens]RED97080.1 hypothetical protein C7460_113129 [Marinoscillum furvescens DSM 4134]